MTATLVLALSFAGCKSAPPPPDDNSLNSALQSKFNNDAAISAEPITTFVQGGTATLQGAVSSQAAKALAASDAAQVPGIRAVVNQLTVQTAQSAQAAPQTPTPSVVAPVLPPAPARTTKPSATVKRRVERPAPPPVDASAPIERRPLPVSPPSDQQASQTPPVPRPASPAFRNVTIPSGTTLPVRITQTLDSATTQTGDSFSGTIATDVVVDGLVALPAGTAVNGHVDEVHEAAHFKGSSLLTISLASINRNGQRTTVTTDPLSKQGTGRGKNTAEKVGGGAAIGAILGGIFGGGSGAAIGAATGGGLGAGANTITRGQQVQIPSETLLRFNLSNPVDVRASTAQSGRGSDTNLQPRDNN